MSSSFPNPRRLSFACGPSGVPPRRTGRSPSGCPKKSSANLPISQGRLALAHSKCVRRFSKNLDLILQVPLRVEEKMIKPVLVQSDDGGCIGEKIVSAVEASQRGVMAYVQRRQLIFAAIQFR